MNIKNLRTVIRKIILESRREAFFEKQYNAARLSPEEERNDYWKRQQKKFYESPITNQDSIRVRQNIMDAGGTTWAGGFEILREINLSPSHRFGYPPHGYVSDQKDQSIASIQFTHSSREVQKRDNPMCKPYQARYTILEKEAKPSDKSRKSILRRYLFKYRHGGNLGEFLNSFPEELSDIKELVKHQIVSYHERV